LIDSSRPYIFIDSYQWYWASVPFSKNNIESFLNYSNMPTHQSNKFILLRDLHGGADGRVWLACTTYGLVGVLKFGQLKDKEDDLTKVKIRLEGEAKLWRDVWKQKNVRVITLAGDHALLMPYVTEVDSNQINKSTILRDAVQSAVRQMATAGYHHKDLHWRHVGILETVAINSSKGKKKKNYKKKEHQTPTSPTSPTVILFDLAMVEPSTEEQAMTHMMTALKLNK
jgi:hypothetical protein